MRNDRSPVAEPTDKAGVAGIALRSRFADALPALATPWQAEESPRAELLLLNETLAGELGLDAEWLRSDDGVRFLTGALLPEGATPVAQIYSGHQFGWYSPRLGDGRALLLGELESPSGELRDLHLKGSGRTPYARAGDGQAVLGPMLREFIVSEAMAALGVPTTRGLAVVKTGRIVQRDFPEQGAIHVRVASSHLRVGSFQYARSLDDPGVLRALADHAIDRHVPEARESAHPVLELYRSVIAAQARLVARWMLLGFIHGVMNTDNMTISGETIDYGPCAFLDAYDPATWFSSIDQDGRYSYENQPAIAEWNLARLGEALLPLLADDQAEGIATAEAALREFAPQYRAAWTAGMRDKLGLPATVGDAQVDALGNAALALLRDAHGDFTRFFRGLAGAADGDDAAVSGLGLDASDLAGWLDRWRAYEPDAATIRRTNPVVVPRNHLVEEALEAANGGDLAPVGALLEAVTDPFAQVAGRERYATGAPESFGPYVTYCGT